MGFPTATGYSDLLLPKLLLHLLLLLSLLRRLLSSAFRSLGLPLEDPALHGSPHPDLKPALARLPAAVLYEVLEDPAATCCAVCLHSFRRRDEVRRLVACRHVFHRRCLDPWLHLHHRTCPLCRAPLPAAPGALVWEPRGLLG